MRCSVVTTITSNKEDPIVGASLKRCHCPLNFRGLRSANCNGAALLVFSGRGFAMRNLLASTNSFASTTNAHPLLSFWISTSSSMNFCAIYLHASATIPMVASGKDEV